MLGGVYYEVSWSWIDWLDAVSAARLIFGVATRSYLVGGALFAGL